MDLLRGCSCTMPLSIEVNKTHIRKGVPHILAYRFGVLGAVLIPAELYSDEGRRLGEESH